MKQKLNSLTKNRLKRSSFVHESKRLSRQYQDQLPSDVLPLNETHSPEPWVANQSNIKVYTTVPCLIPGEEQDDCVKKALTLAMIADRYPEEAWTHVYTDGSATNAVANGGAGIHVTFSDGETLDCSTPTGKHCTNYRAKAEALMQAASIVHGKDTNQVVFLSDALSVLQAYQSNKLPSLTEALQEVAHGRRVVLQWIPAHCGVQGNEQADRLAKLPLRMGAMVFPSMEIMPPPLPVELTGFPLVSLIFSYYSYSSTFLTSVLIFLSFSLSIQVFLFTIFFHYFQVSF